MDLDETITVTKLETSIGRCYLMVGWQNDSFEMYLYTKDKLWKGRFSPKRLTGFSRNLQIDENTYFKSIKHCLSQARSDYIYELKSGFFYWKHVINSSIIIEGFIPVQADKSSVSAQPDLIDVTLALNKHLIEKLDVLKSENKEIRMEYEKCLKDTEEFFNLKIEMEKALCEKFMNLLQIKKSKINLRTQDSLRTGDCNQITGS